MQKKKPALLAAVLTFLIVCLTVNSALVSSASGILKEAMSGNEVKSLQRNLKILGYFNEEPTGYFCSIIKEAVIKLQSQQGLDKDGIAGPKTFSVIDNLLNQRLPLGLREVPQLKEGMSGNSVTSLQQDLKALGYLSVNPTGILGN